MSPRIVGHTHKLKRSRSRLTRDRSGQLGTAGGSGVIRAPARAVFFSAVRSLEPITRAYRKQSKAINTVMGSNIPTVKTKKSNAPLLIIGSRCDCRPST